VTVSPGSGDNFTAIKMMYNSAGQLVANAFDLTNGTGSLQLLASGLTVTSGSGALSLTASGHTFSLTAHSVEGIQAAASGGDTIVYHSGFGQSSVSNFLSSGASHDTLQFDSSMFSGVSAGKPVADWSAMLLSGAASQSGANVAISDLANDRATLTSTQLSALTTSAASDFLFV
jgi:serralysin